MADCFVNTPLKPWYQETESGALSGPDTVPMSERVSCAKVDESYLGRLLDITADLTIDGFLATGGRFFAATFTGTPSSAVDSNRFLSSRTLFRLTGLPKRGAPSTDELKTSDSEEQRILCPQPSQSASRGKSVFSDAVSFFPLPS